MLKAKISRFNKQLQKQMTDLGLACNIIKGHEDYTRFIILGMPRTGSNFLASSLRSHKNIVTYGELFSEQSRMRRDILWDSKGYQTSQRALVLRDEDPIGFLEDMVYKNMPVAVQAVGFKLFYHQADENWECVWSYLQSQKLKVLHLKRKNYLKVFLSLTVAMRTKQFVSSSKKVIRQQPVELDYGDCLRWFERSKAWEEKYDAFFKDSLMLYYDDLVNDYDRQMHEVQKYLNVNACEVSSVLKKQAQLPLDKAIENYGQLKNRFSGTEWEVFFEEATE
jgi:LPS sulfotransferase NodH